MTDDEQVPMEAQEATDGPSTTAYKTYTTSLSLFPSLTADQRVRLLRQSRSEPMDREGLAWADWAEQRLWTDACRFVLFVFRRLREDGKLPYIGFDDMDVIQEGNIAAGQAMRTWDPDKGAFSTWLYPRIRGAMLDYVATELQEGLGHRLVSLSAEGGSEELPECQDMSGVDQTECLSLEDILVGDKEPFTSPYDYTYNEQLREYIYVLKESTDLLVSYFYHDESAADIAKRRGITEAAVYNQLRKVLRYKYWKNF